MAGPQAPSQYESVTIPPRLPFVILTSNRDGTVTKDARLVNCYIEVDKEGELDIYKRPGIALKSTVAAGQLGRGIFFWNGNLYSIFGNRLYKDGVLLGGVISDTNGVYRFDSILGATPKMVFGNGHDAYSTDGTTVSATWNSIDSDYPTTTVKGFAYLNGPIYVMQPQAVIWGSAVNSVDQAGDWDPLNFIRAQIEPDQGVFMSKQLVYVVALKQWTIEYFFDAGNATGSPLGSVQGMKLAFGCAHQDSVQKINDVLFFLSIDQTNSLQMSAVDKGSHTIISTPSIDRLLSDSNITTVYSWQLKIDGHSWYIVTFKESNLTLAYDITQDLWFQWTDTNGNYFPIVASAYDAQGRHVLQHEDDGTLLYISNDYAKDMSDPIIQDIITPNFDAGTFRRKYLKQLKLIGDKVEGAVVQIRHNNDDYDPTKWSPWREIDMNAKNPMITDCGTFTRRAYQIRFTKDLRVRLRAAEVQYDVGSL
jgi:hypothetical protein